MSCEFYVGQKVVCIERFSFAPFIGPDNEPIDYDVGPNPEYGYVYTIDLIERVVGSVFFVLEEMGDAHSYEYIHFRPLRKRKTDISVFEKLLVPSKAKQPEQVS